MTDSAPSQLTNQGRNVLILSAASKVRLVERFKTASEPYGAKVYVSDFKTLFAAQFFADGTVTLPHTSDPSFVKELTAQLQAYDIGLVVPTRDGELALMADLAPQLAGIGTIVLVSPAQAIAQCQDKKDFLEALTSIGLSGTPCVKHDDVTAADFPMFTRPRSGAGSVGAQRFDRLDDLKKAAIDPDLMLLHPYIDLAEYSVDCLFDLDGKPLQAVTRTRENIVAGESKSTTIIKAPQVTEPCLALGAHLGLRGHVIFQVFWDGQSEPVFIEVNPRFGGASDSSIEAGLMSPDRIMALLYGPQGDHAAARKPRVIRYGLTMLRYNRDVFVEPDTNA